MKRLRALLIFILFVILFVFLAYLFFDFLKVYFSRKKLTLQNELSMLKSEYTFFRYQINSIIEGRINFTFYLIDMNGRILTNDDAVIEGKDIFVESKVIIFNPTNSIVFPLRIFSDIITPEKAILIKDFYPFPLYQDGEMAKFLNKIFSYYVLGQGDIGIYRLFIQSEADIVLHSVLPLKEGDVFECILHQGGQLELKRSEL